MAFSGPSLTFEELDAFSGYLRLIVSAGAAGRDPANAGRTPAERWAPFRPAAAAASLSDRVATVIARYDWRRTDAAAGTDAALEAVAEMLSGTGPVLPREELRCALVAAAFWLNPSEQTAFTDDAALAAVDTLNGFVNGFVQSLPGHRIPGEHAEAQNRRFRAYQRRRFGYDLATRSPQALVKRLPPAAHELINAYDDHLSFGSIEEARAIAATAAVAMGRPLDTTVVRQLEITLAAANVWRDISELPNTPESHVLLGTRPVEDPRRWDAAVVVVAQAMQFLRSPTPPASDPALVHLPALVPVAGVRLDAMSLQGLTELDNYVNLFSAWLRNGFGLDLPPAERLAAFDAAIHKGTALASKGADVLSELPPQAMKVVAAFSAVMARGKHGDDIADELAAALGDRNLTKRYWRTLHTASCWLEGTLSPLERAQSPAPEEENTEADTAKSLEPFLRATQHEAETLLDLGAAITELVRFSRTLGTDGRAPEGWWIKFHRRELASVPTPRTLMERLPDGARRLLRQHAQLLASEQFADMRAVPRALASKLDRMSEEHSARTLAVALAAGVIWSDLGRLSRGRRSDSVLGADPDDKHHRYVCARAQAQLEWGLQELLDVESALNV